MTDTGRRDELLGQLLGGGVKPTSPEAIEAFEGDPGLRREYEELRELQRELDAAGVKDQVLDEIRDASWPEGEVIAEAAVLGWGKRRPARFRRVAAVLAAAAAVLAIVWIGGGEPSREIYPRESLPVELEDRLLGASGLPGAYPEGPVESFRRFEWDLELRSDTWQFELIVYDASEGAGFAVVAGPIRLTESSWAPSEEELRSWPDDIVWTLGLVEPGGAVQEPYSVEASVSP